MNVFELTRALVDIDSVTPNEEAVGKWLADYLFQMAVQTGGRDGGEIFATANTFRPGPDAYLYPFFNAKGSYNLGGYNNPSLDSLMVEARQISNLDQRRSLYTEIQRTLLADSPYWWWYAKLNIEALSTKFHGYQQSFTGRRIFLKKTWMAG